MTLAAVRYPSVGAPVIHRGTFASIAATAAVTAAVGDLAEIPAGSVHIWTGNRWAPVEGGGAAGTDVKITGMVAAAVPGHFTATLSDATTFDVDLTSLIDAPGAALVASTVTPAADTVAGTIGTSVDYARADHAHPAPAAVAETPLTVTDSQTINLTAAGTAGHALSADLIIDTTTPGNVTLTSTANGLRATFTVGADLHVTNILPAVTPGHYTVLLSDASTFDVDLSALVAPTPSAVAPLADGPAAVVGTSIEYARADHIHPESATATTVDLATTGDAFAITVNGVTDTVTPAPGTIVNTLGFDAAGDLVAEPVAAAPTTVDLTGAADGLTITVNGTADTLTPAPGTIVNSIGFDAAGDLVASPAAVETAITITDTDSIDLTSSGTAGHTLAAALRVDTVNPGNVVLTVTADGLTAAYTPDADIRIVSITPAVTPGHYTANLSDLTTFDVDLSGMSETALTGVATDTIAIVPGGVRGHELRADLRINTMTPGNVALTADGNGLAATFTIPADMRIVNVTADVNPGHFNLIMSDGSIIDADLTTLIAPTPAAAAPLAAAALPLVGTSPAFAREDHVHPTTHTWDTTGGQIVSTVDGVSAVFNPIAGTPVDFLGFDAAGDLVKGASAGGTSVTQADVPLGTVSQVLGFDGTGVLVRAIEYEIGRVVNLPDPSTTLLDACIVEGSTDVAVPDGFYYRIYQSWVRV